MDDDDDNEVVLGAGFLGIGLLFVVSLVIGFLAGCASPSPLVVPEAEPECFAPWEVEPYKSGRAIPGPGVDGILVPLCDKARLPE